MNITIKTIPHKKQRYETVGDWWFEKDGTLQIRVSDMGNWQYEFLVALHELCEVVLCKVRGITTAKVDKFDKQFEKDRSFGKHSQDEEAGDHIDAPYRREHFFATNIERLMSDQLEVDWKTYDERVMSL